MTKQIMYNELSKAKIADKRNIVLSEKSNGGYILAQQILFTEGENKFPVFLKGAISIDDKEGLYNLRDALNEAITIIEK